MLKENPHKMVKILLVLILLITAVFVSSLRNLDNLTFDNLKTNNVDYQEFISNNLKSNQ
jgi:hypothetical protein